MLKQVCDQPAQVKCNQANGKETLRDYIYKMSRGKRPGINSAKRPGMNRIKKTRSE